MTGKTSTASSKTIIIGAGAGGLAAGHYLVKAGMDCAIYERSSVPGGRIQLLRKGSDIVDVGTQYFHTNYVETLKILDDLGLKNQLIDIKAPVRMVRYGREYHIKHTTVRLKMVPFISNLRAAKPMIKTMLNMRRIDPYYNSPLPEWEGVELVDYTMKTMDREALEFFVRPIVNAFNQSDPEGESLAHFMRMMRQYLTAADTGLPTGMYTFPEAMAKRLPVTYNAEAKELVFEDGRIAGVKIKTGGSVKTVPAERVICAGPLRDIGELLPGLSAGEKRVIQDYRYSKMVMVVFFMKRRISDNFWAWVLSRTEGFKAADVSDALFKCGTMVPSGRSILQVHFIGDSGEEIFGEKDASVIELARNEMRRIVPNFDGEVDSVEVIRQPTGMSRYMVGIYPRLRGFLESMKRYRGLHLVGDFYGHSTIETVVRSARRAVDAIAAGK
jgi:protoporphyrinogen oxidase